MLLFGAEPEHGLDHGAVVPTAVEQDHLAAAGELGHIPLEVPLRPLLLGRLAEGHHAVVLLVHVAGDAADGAALSRRIAALEHHDHALRLAFEVALQLQQLHLIGLEGLFPRVALDELGGPPSLLLEFGLQAADQRDELVHRTARQFVGTAPRLRVGCCVHRSSIRL